MASETESFIKRLVQHIPDKGFRMIRYYGFLANCLRSRLLPIVYNLLAQPERYVRLTLLSHLIKRYPPWRYILRL